MVISFYIWKHFDCSSHNLSQRNRGEKNLCRVESSECVYLFVHSAVCLPPTALPSWLQMWLHAEWPSVSKCLCGGTQIRWQRPLLFDAHWKCLYIIFVLLSAADLTHLSQWTYWFRAKQLSNTFHCWSRSGISASTLYCYGYYMVIVFLATTVIAFL